MCNQPREALAGEEQSALRQQQARAQSSSIGSVSRQPKGAAAVCGPQGLCGPLALTSALCCASPAPLRCCSTLQCTRSCVTVGLRPTAQRTTPSSAHTASWASWIVCWRCTRTWCGVAWSAGGWQQPYAGRPASRQADTLQERAVGSSNRLCSRLGRVVVSCCACQAWYAHAMLMLRPSACSVITYSSLISACEKAGRWETALQLFDEMQRDGCTPNTVTYNSLITACGQGECAWRLCGSCLGCASLGTGS